MSRSVLEVYLAALVRPAAAVLLVLAIVQERRARRAGHAAIRNRYDHVTLVNHLCDGITHQRRANNLVWVAMLLVGATWWLG